jgi:hypothetical protein
MALEAVVVLTSFDSAIGEASVTDWAAFGTREKKWMKN